MTLGKLIKGHGNSKQAAKKRAAALMTVLLYPDEDNGEPYGIVAKGMFAVPLRGEEWVQYLKDPESFDLEETRGARLKPH